MGDLDYVYAVARIRVKEKSLLTDMDISQMTALPDARAVLSYVEDRGWGDAESSGDADGQTVRHGPLLIILQREAEAACRAPKADDVALDELREVRVRLAEHLHFVHGRQDLCVKAERGTKCSHGRDCHAGHGRRGQIKGRPVRFAVVYRFYKSLP